MKILSFVGVLWGGMIMYNSFGRSYVNPQYDAGAKVAGFIGLLMFVAGLFSLMKGSNRS